VVFTHIKFFLLFFFISSSKCGIVLFVVLCSVWFRVLSWWSFISYWKIYISQLQIQPIIWASTLQIRKHGYFGDLGFIILFGGILPMYAINLGVVSLSADLPFYVFSDVCILCTLSIWMNEYRFVFVKKNIMIYNRLV